MQTALSELRLDIPLPAGADARGFERGWRETLAAQKLTALAAPPSAAVSARFRLCGPDLGGERGSAWERYLTARLSALPGTPSVAADPAHAASEWQGVKVWLSYPSRDLAAVLKKSKQKPHSSHHRGRRP